ncbi:YbfB/YjiJ family MFS transporter [Chelatococcus reniformis]|uniref:MFS transporter n=1 Tax=Chelatococcus reniformis TaxID=1494448 RepID=A0A916XKB8_9HYPH|nr:YbfB/YjiJ family MFS transporter [Chelatococcus reniformis]GGC80705.1 MFS transporter [Chelatococcus reniformis]
MDDPAPTSSSFVSGTNTAAGPKPWRMTLSALCCYLIAVGLARFAYTPLIPALVHDQWFSAAQAAYLGAANLAGYLIGAVLSRRLAALAPTAALLRIAMVIAALSFFACAAPAPFTWFLVWRATAGFVGAVLIILAAPFVLPHIAAERRGLAAGMMFVGPGSGIVLAGLVVPELLTVSLTATWIGLGLICAVLVAVAWSGWPAEHRAPPTPTRATDGPGADAAEPALWLLAAVYAIYALSSVGLVPHMLFLVDYVARGLGRGIVVGSYHWALFGLGAMIGPLVAGGMGDRFGFRLTLRLSLLIQATGVGVLALTPHPLALIGSSLLIGAFIPAISVLTLGRIQEITTGATAANAWRVATIGFAVGQAAAAYGLSYIFSATESYRLLYGLGAATILVAFAVDLLMDALAQRRATRA